MGWLELEKQYSAGRDYLHKYVYPHREMWCHVWTRRYTTFGARTTQRCESVNSVLKSMLERNSTLDQLVKTIVSISDNWAAKRDSLVHQPTMGTRRMSIRLQEQRLVRRR